MTFPVTLCVWRVPRRAVPPALVRMARDPQRLRATPGVRFAKMLGTGEGLAVRDADLTRYAALVVWDGPEAGTDLDATPTGRGWARIATASARLDLRLLKAKGNWSRREPFGEPGPEEDGPVLALTRARLKARKALTFWRAVPPVAAAVENAPGLLAHFGVGEAPIGWQGTVSVWRNAAYLARFAYRHPEHRAAITRTSTEKWYAEDLFARFAVLGVMGDRSVLGWSEGGHGRA
ncbi:monooxygenase [Micromonospora sp. CPCC 205371]|nr:monooxygenase [Micromonospora sp. CPCC 205371]